MSSNSRKTYPRERHWWSSSKQSEGKIKRVGMVPDSIYDKYPRTYGHGPSCAFYDGGDRSLWPVDEDANEEPASVTSNAEESAEEDARGTTSTSPERIPPFQQLPTHKNVFTRRRRRYSNNSNILQIGDVDLNSFNSSSSELLPSTESSDASCPTSSPSAAFLKELAVRHSHGSSTSSVNSARSHAGSRRRSSNRNRRRSHSLSKIETELTTKEEESEKFGNSHLNESQMTKESRGCHPRDDKQKSKRRYSSDEIYAKTLQMNLPEIISSVPHARSEIEKSGDSYRNHMDRDTLTSSSGENKSYQYYWNYWWEMLMGEKEGETETTSEEGHCSCQSSQKTLGLKETTSMTTTKQRVQKSQHHHYHASVSVLCNKDGRRGVLIPKRLSM